MDKPGTIAIIIIIIAFVIFIIGWILGFQVRSPRSMENPESDFPQVGLFNIFRVGLRLSGSDYGCPGRTSVVRAGLSLSELDLGVSSGRTWEFLRVGLWAKNNLNHSSRSTKTALTVGFSITEGGNADQVFDDIPDC
ncbi:hypothetical protein OSB04_029383 [Centaurea solstitialis]|uniref:Uncharacterized protein n=1 Tax=Centaurea solstitialis TaxID=347529 RepID=A0AA38T131_9ASTR|nr:hypothetical protein OSB04_029383 [Centaurea solstitialis]